MRWAWLAIPVALGCLGAVELDEPLVAGGGFLAAMGIALYRQGERVVERLDHLVELHGGAPRKRRRAPLAE